MNLWITLVVVISLAAVLGLVVIPELRLSDLGLVDAVNFSMVSPFIEP